MSKKKKTIFSFFKYGRYYFCTKLSFLIKKSCKKYRFITKA